jgi:hypothetical protein
METRTLLLLALAAGVGYYIYSQQQYTEDYVATSPRKRKLMNLGVYSP